MMEKWAPARWVGGCTHTPFHYIYSTITFKVVVYAPAERADTLPLFLLYPYMYSVLTTSPSTNPVLILTPIPCYTGGAYKKCCEQCQPLVREANKFRKNRLWTNMVGWFLDFPIVIVSLFSLSPASILQNKYCKAEHFCITSVIGR